MSERKKGGAFVRNGNEPIELGEVKSGVEKAPAVIERARATSFVVGREISPEELDRLGPPTDGSVFG